MSNYVAFNVYANMDVSADSVTKGVADSVATLPVTDSVTVKTEEIFQILKVTVMVRS